MMVRFSRLIMIALLWSVPLGAMAQQPATAPTQPLLKPAELDQLLAPIALHPDPLLSEVLIASTYPLEIVQADRWAKSNEALKGDALTAALGKQSWDDSVKSLVQVPDVLSMMSEQLDWTQKLGDAVLAQQADVMDAVQRLRARARAKASEVAEEHPAWQRVVAEERPGWVAAERPAWPRVVAVDEAAVAGGQMLRLSTTSRFSAIWRTALVSIASAITAATKSMSASWRRKCKRSCRRRSCAAETATLRSSTTSSA
jgi:hypothetical protein